MDPIEAAKVLAAGTAAGGVGFVLWIVVLVEGYAIFRLAKLVSEGKDKLLEEEKKHSAKVESMAQSGAVTMDRILAAIEGRGGHDK